jgi:hypothetical protein
MRPTVSQGVPSSSIAWRETGVRGSGFSGHIGSPGTGRTVGVRSTASGDRRSWRATVVGTCWSEAATSVPRAFGGAEDMALWASGERRSTGLAAAAGIAIGPDEESTRRGAARARVQRQALTKPCGSRTNFFDAPLSKSL